MAGDRPRHPIKEFEALLREAEAKDWRVTKGKAYFRMLCPCEQQHKKWLHLTPSDPNYLRNAIGQLRRTTCWEEQP